MCGFTGFLSSSTQLSRSDIQAIAQNMSDALIHRGPDAGDIWQDPDVICALGHRRLSIIDLSAEGAQPMESASGRYMIAFNGEIYNFPELRSLLESKGHTFRGHSDTEIMLAAIEEWGLNQAIQKFNGMFAFALWDRKERVMHFARDRFGKKPLYIGWAGNTLVFGSELKALCAHPEFKRALNPDAAALYMRYSCMPAPHSIYQNTWSLRPGHRMTIPLEMLSPGEDLSGKMECYYNLLETLEDASLRVQPRSDNEVVAEFENILSTCVKDRMMSDVPLGAFLSGGIDSSLIVAMMQKQSSRPVKTYTIGFEEAGFNEAAYAKDVAAHLGTEHRELYLTARDALDIISSLPTMFDEPFADISAIPTALVCKFARQDVTVALSGDGGDEMMGGYNRHVQAPRIWNKIQHIPAPLRKALASGISSVPTETWNKIIPKLPQPGTRLHKIADFMNLKSQSEVYQRLIETWQYEDDIVPGAKKLPIPLCEARNQNLDLGFAESMMYWDTLSYLPDDILAKVDRASMAVSLEARAPLLDRRIYEYAWQLPLEMKIRNGKGKWLLRKVLGTYVPENLFERPKQGFTMPVGQWLRGPLKEWGEDLLDAQKLEEDGLLGTVSIRKAWNDHQAGRGNNTEKLWTALMFQAWKRQWIG